MGSGLDVRPVLSTLDAVQLHFGNVELIGDLLHRLHTLFVCDHLLDALYCYIGQLVPFLTVQ